MKPEFITNDEYLLIAKTLNGLYIALSKSINTSPNKLKIYDLNNNEVIIELQDVPFIISQLLEVYKNHTELLFY